MSVDTHVSRSTGKRLALSVRNVLLRLGIAVLLGHSEVDNVNDILRLRVRSAYEEIVGLDVSVDEVLLVDGLYPRQLGHVSRRKRSRRSATYHLLCYHDHGLDGEFAVAMVEEVLQAGPQQVNDQDVVEALLTEVVDIRNAGWDRVSRCGLASGWLF